MKTQRVMIGVTVLVLFVAAACGSSTKSDSTVQGMAGYTAISGNGGAGGGVTIGKGGADGGSWLPDGGTPCKADRNDAECLPAFPPQNTRSWSCPDTSSKNQLLLAGCNLSAAPSMDGGALGVCCPPL